MTGSLLKEIGSPSKPVFQSPNPAKPSQKSPSVDRSLSQPGPASASPVTGGLSEKVKSSSKPVSQLPSTSKSVEMPPPVLTTSNIKSRAVSLNSGNSRDLPGPSSDTPGQRAFIMTNKRSSLVSSAVPASSNNPSDARGSSSSMSMNKSKVDGRRNLFPVDDHKSVGKF